MESLEARLMTTLNTRTHLLFTNVARLSNQLAYMSTMIVNILPVSIEFWGLFQRLARVPEM